jgi:hypothetical protein
MHHQRLCCKQLVLLCSHSVAQTWDSSAADLSELHDVRVQQYAVVQDLSLHVLVDLRRQSITSGAQQPF